LPKSKNFIIIPIIFLCSSLFGLSWAISSPPGSASDEIYHLGSTWCAWGENEICQFNGEAMDNGRRDITLTSDFSKAGCFRSDMDKVNKSAACYLQDVSQEERFPWEMNSGNYPGLNYTVLRIFATNNIEASVIAMRFFNYFIFSLLLILAYISLSGKIYFASILSFFVTLIPVSIFFLTSINPSSWTIIGIGFYWAFLWDFLDVEKITERKKIAAGLVLSSILSIGSRSDASIYTLVINFLFFISIFFRRKVVKELAMKIALTTTISLWGIIQFFYNKQFEAESKGGEKVSGVELFLQNFAELPKYYLGIFGGRGPEVWPFGLGWFDTQLPIAVPILGVASLLFVLIFVFNKMGLRQRIVVYALPLFMILIPLSILQLRQSNAIYFLQPRYLIPLLIVFIGVLTVEIKSVKNKKRIISFVLISLTIGNSISLFTNLKRYTVGLDSEVNFFSKVDWWWNFPITPGFTWVVGTFAFPIFLYLALSRDTKSRIEIKN